MKLEDLRIGNYYNSVKFKQSVKCDLTDFYELCIKSDGATDDPPINEVFEPIYLTEDWLLKLGFKKFSSDFQLNNVIIHTRIRGFVINKKVPILKYVHQLQNYYFTNRGTELTIKS